MLEFGDLDELAAKHAGEDVMSMDELAVMTGADTKPSYIVNAKAAMLEEGAEEMYL